MGLESKKDTFEDVLSEEYLEKEIDIDRFLAQNKEQEEASSFKEQEQEKAEIPVVETEEKETIEQEEGPSEEEPVPSQGESDPIATQGLVGNRFDQNPVGQETDFSEGGNELEGKEFIKVVYGFTADEVKKALQIFQKFTLYKRSMIYSLIIAVLFFLYLYRIIGSQNADKFSIFMCVVIVSALAFIWYFPLMHIKQVVKSVASMEYKEEYILKVYDSAIVVGEGTSQNLFFYRDGKIKVWEDQELFVIGNGKERVFAVPKRCVEGGKEECRRISSLFQNGLGDNYRYVG